MSSVITQDMVAVGAVTRTFGSGRTATRALRGVSFTVKPGQLVALRGRSGSGKTTLLNIVGGLDLPDGGTVRVAGREVTAMSAQERMRLRRTSVAFIFQSFGLIPILSAAENVGVPLRIAGMAPREREERVRLMLDIVGLGEHARQRPGELSGGQQQRVAIARALAGSPQLLLADEPTGQLDSETAKQIMRLLHTVVESEGVTALVATHDPTLIGIADSVLALEDGKIKTDLSERPGVLLPGNLPLIPGYAATSRYGATPMSCRSDERQRRVDPGDIAWIAGNDGMPPVACADGHAHVHYVRRPSGRAPGTHPKRHLGVQRDDRRVRRAQQASDPGLTSAAAPRLGQHPGRDGQIRAAGESFLHQHRHPCAARLKRDQRPGVEGRAVHGSMPSTRRAHSRSSSVGWPLSA
jgi:putative ABC transport system ATP-binding protein